MTETVSSVVQETEFETQCATVNDRECRTEIQTSYTTTLETQCSPGYGTKARLLIILLYLSSLSPVQA